MTKTPLERFSECSMKLELGDKTDIVECKGKVVWIVPTQDEKAGDERFDVGIEFVDMDKKSKALIVKYLEEFNSSESEA